ncbi:hypothetical protein MA16_Dca004444 [Dendrobium catenatum]|uniref:Uncharacterized protein n=1 Tax=Dendrobium catenatum TaxID=906689 RepID=A0A2I0W7H4_9ASPA|nr:hypothetical protein MA16_Dca004444 [Dendrobium catenatum]
METSDYYGHDAYRHLNGNMNQIKASSKGTKHDQRIMDLLDLVDQESVIVPPRWTLQQPFQEAEIEDPLLKSSSLPIFDEPVYDVYDDDMLFDVLDVDKTMYDDDQSKMDAPPELCMHIPHVKAINVLAITDKRNDPSKLFYEDGDKPEGDLKDGICCKIVVYFDCYRILKNIVGLWQCEFCKVTSLEARRRNPQLGRCEETCSRVQYSFCSGVDTGWIYPNWFSQPNPPPYGGQPDLFLRAQSFLLPR